MSEASPARYPDRAAPAHEPGERPAYKTPIPAIPLAELLEAHRTLLERLRIAYGGEEGGFEARLLPLIHRYAAFVHLLPATADAHYSVPGGLLRLGLEVGLHAVQVADSQLFAARGTVTERRALAPRWRTAAFLTGLCAELHRPAFALAVIADDDARWFPLRGPLAEWLATGNRTHYVVHWDRSAEPVAAAALVALPHLVDAALADFLATSHPCLVSEVIGALSREPASAARPLATILQQTLARTVDRDLRVRSTGPATSVATAPSRADATSREDLSPDAPATAPPPEADVNAGAAPPASSTVTEPVSGVGPVHQNPPRAAASGEPAAVVPRGGALAIPATLNPVVAEPFVPM